MDDDPRPWDERAAEVLSALVGWHFSIVKDSREGRDVDWSRIAKIASEADELLATAPVRD